MAGSTLHSLIYKISSSADLKGLVATKAELSAAGRIAKETQTKTEQYSTSVAALNALHRKGALDAQTHSRAIAQLGKEMKEAQGAGKGGFGGMSPDTMLAGFGAGFALTQFTDSIKAADEAMQSQARLETALAATGNTTGFTRDQLLEYSDTLRDLTGISDEAFTDAQAELATFGNIHGKVFTDAIRLSADLSKMYGTDLKSEVEGLGRALANPLEALDRLRIGKEKLTSAEKESIKAMAEAGDVLGAQMAIIDIVAGKAEGAAEAMRSPMEGLTQQIGELKEALGGLFKEAGGSKALDLVSGSFKEMAKEITNLREVMKGEGSAMGALQTLSELGDPTAGIKRGLRSIATKGTAEELAPTAGTERAADAAVPAWAKRDRTRPASDIEELNKRDAETSEKALAVIQEKRDAAEAKRLRRLRNTVDIGELNRKDEDTADKALGKLGIDVTEPAIKEAMAKPKEPPRDAGAAAQRGSAEAFSAIVRGMSRGGEGDVPKKQLSVAEQQKQIAAEQLAVAKTAAAKPPAPINVLTF